MDMDMLTEDEMRAFLKHQSGCFHSQKEMADAIGIDPTLLSRMLKGERPISDEVAEFYGRKRVVLFVVPADENND